MAVNYYIPVRSVLDSPQNHYDFFSWTDEKIRTLAVVLFFNLREKNWTLHFEWNEKMQCSTLYPWLTLYIITTRNKL